MGLQRVARDVADEKLTSLSSREAGVDWIVVGSGRGTPVDTDAEMQSSLDAGKRREGGKDRQCLPEGFERRGRESEADARTLI